MQRIRESELSMEEAVKLYGVDFIKRSLEEVPAEDEILKPLGSLDPFGVFAKDRDDLLF